MDLENIKGKMTTMRLKNGYLVHAVVENVIPGTGKLKIFKDSVSVLLLNHPGSHDCIFLEPESFQLIAIEDIVEVQIEA